MIRPSFIAFTMESFSKNYYFFSQNNFLWQLAALAGRRQFIILYFIWWGYTKGDWMCVCWRSIVITSDVAGDRKNKRDSQMFSSPRATYWPRTIQAMNQRRSAQLTADSVAKCIIEIDSTVSEQAAVSKVKITYYIIEMLRAIRRFFVSFVSTPYQISSPFNFFSIKHFFLSFKLPKFYWWVVAGYLHWPSYLHWVQFLILDWTKLSSPNWVAQIDIELNSRFNKIIFNSTC